MLVKLKHVSSLGLWIHSAHLTAKGRNQHVYCHFQRKALPISSHGSFSWEFDATTAGQKPLLQGLSPKESYFSSFMFSCDMLRSWSVLQCHMFLQLDRMSESSGEFLHMLDSRTLFLRLPTWQIWARILKIIHMSIQSVSQSTIQLCILPSLYFC